MLSLLCTQGNRLGVGHLSGRVEDQAASHTAHLFQSRLPAVALSCVSPHHETAGRPGGCPRTGARPIGPPVTCEGLLEMACPVPLVSLHMGLARLPQPSLPPTGSLKSGVGSHPCSCPSSVCCPLGQDMGCGAQGPGMRAPRSLLLEMVTSVTIPSSEPDPMVRKIELELNQISNVKPTN